MLPQTHKTPSHKAARHTSLAFDSTDTRDSTHTGMPTLQAASENLSKFYKLCVYRVCSNLCCVTNRIVYW